MKIKDILTNTFGYTPKASYQFSLPANHEKNTAQDNKQISDESSNVFTNLDKNLDYIKTKYNLLINSDIVTREFILNARGKQYKAFLLYIDGMVDSQILNDFVLEPLMMRNKNNLFNNEQNRVISESSTNNITEFFFQVRVKESEDKLSLHFGFLQNHVHGVNPHSTFYSLYPCSFKALFDPPLHQISFIFEMIIKGVTVHSDTFCDIGDSNLSQGFLFHKALK